MRLRSTRSSAVSGPASRMLPIPSWELTPQNAAAKIAAGEMTFSRGTLATQVNADGSISWCAHNLLLNSENIQGAGWSNFGSSGSALSQTEISLPATGSVFGQARPIGYAPIGLKFTAKFLVSGTGTVTLGVDRSGFGAYEDSTSVVTLTAVPTWYSVAWVVSNTGQTGAEVFITRGAGQTAAIVTLHASSLCIGDAQPYYKTGSTPYYGLRTADYSDNPTTPGIKIEPQATNLQTYSGNLLGAPWNTRAGMETTPGHRVGPDGVTQCALFKKGTSSDGYIFAGFAAPLPNTTYTISFWICGVGTVYVNAWPGVNPAVQSVNFTASGSWVRRSFTFTTPANAGGYGDYGINLPAAAEVSIFGFQIETGHVATSYIPTSGSTVTRGADLLKADSSKIASWDSSKGSIVFDEHFGSLISGTYPRVLVSGSAVLTLLGDNKLAYFESPVGNDYAFSSGIQLVGIRSKLALACSASSAQLAVGGVAQSQISLTGWPLSNFIEVGNLGGRHPFSIYRIDYHPRALPALAMRRLTA